MKLKFVEATSRCGGRARTEGSVMCTNGEVHMGVRVQEMEIL